MAYKIYEIRGKRYRRLRLGERIRSTDSAWCKDTPFPQSEDMPLWGEPSGAHKVESTDGNYYYREVQS